MITRRLAALLLAALALTQPALAAPGPAPTEIRYASAPELRAALAQQRGRVVILNLWATWCVSCLREIPDLVAVAGEFAAEGVVLLGVAMDEPRDLETLVKPFHAKFFPAFPTVMRREADMDTMAEVVDPAWNEVMPTTYILDRRGNVQVRLQGRQAPQELRSRVRAALAAGPR
jgi:cytochrome c biogenesis protein CcmG/thiol:disulfide interchange protein DsbE